MKASMHDNELQLLLKTAERCNLYFEFGCGGSTVEVAKNTEASIYSIDSSKEWLEKVDQEIGGRKNTTCKHINIGPLKEWGHPADESHKNLWPNYSNALIDSRLKPEIILVDGRFRVACILKSIKYSLDNKLDTKIILHDSQRYENNKHKTYFHKYLDEVAFADDPIKKQKKCPSRGLSVFKIKKEIKDDRLLEEISKWEFYP